MRLFFIHATLLCFFAGFAITAPMPGHAQSADPFENGWTLDPTASQLRFMSIKKGNVAETSSFATFSGLITEQGTAQIRVLMESVDTKIDLRNVRMRFLFFETFMYPDATITAQLDASTLRDLHVVRRKQVKLDFALTLHGITINKSADVFVTLVDNDRVAVSSTAPIALTLAELGLDEGRVKLEEAANVNITPVGIVSFDFVFDRSSPGTPPDMELVSGAVQQGSAALETKGNLDREACLGRFEILSRTGSIYFAAGSARLDAKSTPLLDNVYDIVSRCPDLAVQIAGHTDSDGNAAWNLKLSEQRAAAVATYLRNKGIPAGRLTTVGYGETQPLVPNTSGANKARNRRIEFSAVN